MKSLRLSTPHVVIMVGVPGSGKSFFAEHFAKTFSAPLVSWNGIREELFNAPQFSKDEDAIIGRVADHMLVELLKTNATVLYEGDTMAQVSRRNLVQTIRKAGYEPLFVWVQTDTATAKSRAQKRGVSGEMFNAALRRFTPLKASDPYVVISGKHTYASQLKIVLRRLSSERSTAPLPAREIGAPQNRRVRIQ